MDLYDYGRWTYVYSSWEVSGDRWIRGHKSIKYVTSLYPDANNIQIITNGNLKICYVFRDTIWEIAVDYT